MDPLWVVFLERKSVRAPIHTNANSDVSNAVFPVSAES